MPEHLRALIVILVLATIVFAFAHKTACTISTARDYTQRRNLWFVLTLAGFLAHNFWVYTFIAIPIIIYANFRENNPTALFFFILFALPMATIPIPGMGLINLFFHLSHARILELFLLFPAFLVLIRRSGTLSFGRTGPDKLLAAYIVLTVVLYLRETSITDTFRQAFYLFIDVFLPYYVISRSLKDMQAFRVALMSLLVAIMVIAMIAIFEAFKHWLLYNSLLKVLGLQGMTEYLGRGGSLRAVVTAGHSIALGYLLVVGLGLYLYVQRFIRNKSIRWLGIALLTVGLIVSFSRGPWIGALLLLVAYIATGRQALLRVIGLVAAAVMALSLIAVLPGGEKVTNFLPFIGKTDAGTIEYRKNLFDTSIIVIKRNPWFGSVDYLKTPEMESLRQGEGIIDIVNTYIQVALETGFVGLGLFVGFFALILWRIYRAIRSIRDRKSEEHLLGRALFATMLSVLLIIFTVSSITIIPIVYWSVAGLGVAYAQMIRKRHLEKVQSGSLRAKNVQIARKRPTRDGPHGKLD
jgi:O-antigen ligase